MNTVQVRQAVEQDLPALQRIEVEATTLIPTTVLPLASRAPMPLGELQACLTASELWVAYEDLHDPIGFVAASSYGTFLHLIEFDVTPRMGRRGIGTKLLQHVCRAASQRGHAAITLTTFKDLPWNAPFYAKQGFAEVAEFAAVPHLLASLKSESERGLRRRIPMIKSSDILQADCGQSCPANSEAVAANIRSESNIGTSSARDTRLVGRPV